jgi:hypothetical protein
MANSPNLDLTDRQRELLIQGLRFVRSGILLEPRDPSEDVRDERNRNVHEVEELISRIQSASGNEAVHA